MEIDTESIEILQQVDEKTKKARQELRKVEKLLSILAATGYKTVKDLQEALKPIDGKEEEYRLLCRQYLTAAGVSSLPSGTVTKRKRLSDMQKEQAARMLKDGSKSNEVAEFFGVSTATVNKIKAEAGLVRAKK